MAPELNDIENLLGRMPLKKPPASLDARIVGRPGRRRRLWAWGAVAGTLAAAAALVIAFALPRPAMNSPAQPVRLEQNWSRLCYDGIVAPDERTPLMKFRHQTVEHVQWIDAARGRRMEMTIPREDVILVKASVD